MATPITNSANISYSFGTNTDTASSNIATTNLLDAYGLIATKMSHNDNWKPSENITYVIHITNTGTEPIYAISLQDNLGGTPSLLDYVPNTAIQNKSGVLTNLTPTAISPLSFTLASPLLTGEIITISYVAKVKNTIDLDINEITNTVTVSGHEESDSGPVISVTPSPFVTIPKAEFANVRISKSVNKEQLASGDELIYTFELENSGNVNADNVVLTDNLPTGFIINNITALTDGIITTFEPEDYSLGSDNKLVLPVSATKTISVPAATSAGVGITIITITGILNA